MDCSLQDILPVNCPRAGRDCCEGPHSHFLAFVSLTPFRDLNVFSLMTIASAPVSLLKSTLLSWSVSCVFKFDSWPPVDTMSKNIPSRSSSSSSSRMSATEGSPCKSTVGYSVPFYGNCGKWALLLGTCLAVGDHRHNECSVSYLALAWVFA